ncbi:MAG TPA: hypothetical protein VGE21_00120 [Flavobacteriales bacterium]
MGEISTEELLQELHGEQLSAVTFVQNHLQLWFDGPGINITNPLTVLTESVSVTSWQPGFRDALCAQITKIVAETEIRDGEAFIIRFKDGSLLSVSLRHQDYTSPEAIYAHGFRDRSAIVI